MRAARPALVATALALAAPAAASGIDERIAGCEACHGPGGQSQRSDVPIIAGQSEKLLLKALHEFRDYARPCPREGLGDDAAERPETMCEVTETLSDEEMASLAQWFSNRPFRPAPQPFDLDRAMDGASLHAVYCAACHPGGGGEVGLGGRLAGQWRPYLARSMEQIRSGEWQIPKVMERKMSEFSPEEIDALLHYYARHPETTR